MVKKITILQRALRQIGQGNPASLGYLLGGGLLMIGINIGCSLGALVVQQPTATPTLFKTPKPTFTFTPFWTATFTPSVTPTPTETPLPTDTPTPTEMPINNEAEEEGAAEAAVAPANTPAPAQPTDTPTPEEPTATPTPAFPFNAVYTSHNTGSPGETRITGWVRIDYEPGFYDTLSGFQMKAVAPDGSVHFSEVSGSGPGDSTLPGTGDNHLMNTKLEIRPYQPGLYRLYLVEGDVQVSAEIEFELSADPLQYVHFDFFKQAE